MDDAMIQGIHWPHTHANCAKYQCRVVYGQNPSYPGGDVIIRDWTYQVHEWGMRFMLAQSNGSWTMEFRNIRYLKDIRTPHIVRGIIHVLAMCFAQGILTRPSHLVWHNYHHYNEFSQALNTWIHVAWAQSLGLKHVCMRFGMQARVACLQKHALAKKIQRTWRKAISDPSYAICRKRLLKEFEECTDWILEDI